MRFALFVAEKPGPGSTQSQQNWSEFLRNFREFIEKSNGDAAWGEGVAWCKLNNGLGTLADLVRCAKEYGISSRTIFFNESPEISLTPGG